MVGKKRVRERINASNMDYDYDKVKNSTNLRLEGVGGDNLWRRSSCRKRLPACSAEHLG